MSNIDSRNTQILLEFPNFSPHLEANFRIQVAQRFVQKENVRAQLTEALKREGIYGSAVEVNIEASSLWKKEEENLDHLYSSKLEEIKEALRSL